MPPWSDVFHKSRMWRKASCCFLPPRGLSSSASALPTSSSRIWSARQRCQPSSSPAAVSAAWAVASSLLSMLRMFCCSAWRNSAATFGVALPWPSPTSCSSLATAACTMLAAFSRRSFSTAGSILALAGRPSARASFGAAGTPRAARSSSAHTGTAGSGAPLSSAAFTVTANAA